MNDIRPEVRPGQGQFEDHVATHPAFALLRFGRISGGRTLFGSEVDNLGYIELEIKPAQEAWHLHEKRFTAQSAPSHIRVAMSYAQFAQAITAMNVGEGVPCTVTRLQGKSVPGIAKIDNSTKSLIQQDIKAAAGKVNQTVDTLMAAIEGLNLSAKAKADLQQKADAIKRELSANMPFILDQMGEAVEHIATAAKTEVEAFITTTLQQIGMNSLRQVAQLAAPTAEPADGAASGAEPR